MDEEQPKKKITLNNFFEQIVEIDKVANMALSNSNMVQSQLNAVQMDLKRLIESLQVNFDSGVQNVQNQINEVTNVIVQEQAIKKSETDALEEQVFAQEDQLQKQVKSKKIGESSFNLFKNVVDPSIQNQVRTNLLAMGLLGLGGSVGGLINTLTDKDEDKDKNNQDDNKSLGFTGFTEENVGDDAFGFGSPFDTDLGIGDDAFGFGSPFDNDTVGDNAFGFGGFDSTEIIKNIIDEKSDDASGKKQLLLMLEKEGDRIENLFELNKTINMEKDVSSITAERNTVEEAINNLKFNKKDNKFGGNDYLQKLIKDKNIKINSNEGITSILNDKTNIEPILNNESISGDLTTIKVDGEEYPRGLGGLGYNPFGPEGGSTYGDSRYDPYSFINENNSNNSKVIDGGTTIIEGGTEVVNEPVIGNQRGEVIADSPSLKTANSPVTAIALSESNSIKNLSIV